MTFKLSDRSKARLEGVDERLVKVVEFAIGISEIDFAVTEGVRSHERQAELLKRGATKTMNSKHLTGHAVDLVAYIDGQVSWEVAVYDDLADAMKVAAQTLGVSIRWGGAWHIGDICCWSRPMECAMNDYIDQRRAAGKRPFIDCPHFELTDC